MMEGEVRLRGSCDSCLQSKVKCSQLKPICRRCAKNGSRCVYSPYQKIGRPSRKQQAEGSSMPDLEGVCKQPHEVGPRPVVPCGGFPHPYEQKHPELDVEAPGVADRPSVHPHSPLPSSHPPRPMGSRTAPHRDSVVDVGTHPNTRLASLARDLGRANDEFAAGSLATPQSQDLDIRLHDFGCDAFAIDQSASSAFISSPASDFDSMVLDAAQFPLTPSSLQTSHNAFILGDDKQDSHRGCSAFSTHHNPSNEPTPVVSATHVPGGSSSSVGGGDRNSVDFGPSFLRNKGDLLNSNLTDPFQVQPQARSSSDHQDTSSSLVDRSSSNGRAHEPTGPSSCARQCCLQLIMLVHRLPEQGSEEVTGTPGIVVQLGKQLQAERDIVLGCGFCMREPQREQTLMLLGVVIGRFLPLLKNGDHVWGSGARIIRHRLLMQQFRAACRLELVAKGQNEVASPSAPYFTEIIEGMLKRIEAQLETGI